MRGLVRGLLARCDLKLTHDRWDAWPATLGVVRRVAERATEGRGVVGVLNVGANDGVSNDLIDGVSRVRDVRGVMLEPQPAAFAALSGRWAGVAGVRCVRAALGDVDGTRRLYCAEFDGEVPGRFSQVASFERRVIAKHGRAIRRAGGRVGWVDVETVSAGTLLGMFGDVGCDVVSIDTEGFDGRAVCLLLGAGFAPRVLVYEHAHVSGVDDAAALGALRAGGYLLARVNGDTLAVHRDVWDGGPL